VLSLTQAGHFAQISTLNHDHSSLSSFHFTLKDNQVPTESPFALSPSAVKMQEHDVNHYLAVIATLPTLDSRQFLFSDFVALHFRSKNTKHDEKRGVFTKVGLFV
jgi:hypothetical protein